MIHLGFTGTRHGMTSGQQAQLRIALTTLAHADAFHHGDCVGADAQAHAIARELGLPCHIHPPLNRTLRAFCRGQVVYPPCEYLARNALIVQACAILLAAPQTREEVQRSGTWATVRHARRCGRQVILLLPEETYPLHKETLQ